ncbi:metallophosphoesterase [Aquisalibacillus elongatus]|uniref:Calcineurin-like phosphoesterase domain-containing protein n=1 Tax=Aquisalibacillus elongatus TaxID=485577 RepID=A0A3N5B5B4_9BACI|nr:metallophosphoesterase [Aquisalibacillus elongatus]RPF52289.1 hypothetical protein EDC24_2283 [Aquisalibacillus elongatus]
MTKKLTRRSFIKRLTFGTLGAVGLSYGGYYYAHELEPKWLKTIYKDVASTRLPSSFDGFKILQITDTHIGFQYNLEEFEKMVNQVNHHSADLIVFTGDLADDPSRISSQTLDKVSNLLSKIEAPYGKYWIYGNHDHGGFGTSIIYDYMERSGFKLLKNETVQIDKDGEYINLSGLDDVLLGRPDLKGLIDSSEVDQFNVLLCHEPDYADEAKQYSFDLQLSGHSHGGQIQLPLIGYIVTPDLGTNYVEGSYEIGERPLQLQVSRGLGTTRLPFRFLCRPEINLYTLVSKS